MYFDKTIYSTVMIIKRIIALLLSVNLLISLALADEGMWTFDNPPLKQWKERYNFEPSKEWIDNLRLASVRLSDGGSSSFVSPNGLLITNQHVAGGQLGKSSTKDNDYIKNGFFAKNESDEIKVSDLEPSDRWLIASSSRARKRAAPWAVSWP